MSRLCIFLRFLALVALFVLPATASAAELKIAVVDFQAALNQVEEGTTAMARLEGMREEKMKVIDGRRQALASMQTELRNQSALLSEQARTAKEEAFIKAQAEFQQLAQQSEQDLQSTYMSIMDGLISKLRDEASAIGRERGYTLILEKSNVVYSSSLDDLTTDLVTRYNQKHPAR
ncbi:MAG: OmpH family outer membrane protein [Deltaproteobacteria bacterium]|nr:OmpH family outer membrane protein [Deltaproteobacteria bacterium]